ncbi:hypothetical protein OBV_18210 [Oscillibacter valericigenes Sjm18-20]|nr:hypothetical protein OBV_18210 [Oscillibacter valericigenes Sjm18-20]
MSKTTILYKDIAPGAEDDASVSTNGAMPFCDISKLPPGIDPVSITSGELNYWGLDGSFAPLDSQDIAFWSTAMSGSGGAFTSPPVITVTFDQQYSSLGVTLAADTATGGYCNSVNIKWYQGTTLKADVDFTPDSAVYYCRQKVTSYDKIVITLNSTNLPYRHAKLEHIIFGVYRTFGMTELRKASLINQMSGISEELPISTMSWTLDSREDVDYMFQLKQPVEVRNNGSLIGVYYIDSFSRSAKSIYDIDCYDAFGVLDEIPFSGGVYSAKSAKTLLVELVGNYFTVDFDGVDDTALTGVIEACTLREAIQQVLFAWGVCASTDGRESIRVFALPSAAAEISKDRTYTGVSVETSAIVTEVRVTAHTYTQDTNGSVEIGGVKYSDTETVYTISNPDVTASDKQNVVEVAGATLVSTAIGQATAQRVYDYYLRRNTCKAKIVWAGELLGDRLTIHNSWDGTEDGNLLKMDIALSNTVAGNFETLGV